MKDDVSEIDSSWCNVLTSSDTLVSYSPNRRTRRYYAFNGGRWIKYRTSTSTSGYDISDYTCTSPSDLNSYAVFEPFIYLVAFFLFIVSILFFKWSLRGILGRF